MAIGKSSAHNYTVVEAQNVALGQTGAAFHDTTDLYTPPTDVEFAALTPESTSFHYGTTAASPGTNGATVATSDTFPKGITIYGRWLSLDLQTAGDKVVIYFGP